MKKILPRIAVFALAGLLFSGCATNLQDETRDWAAEKFYSEAKAYQDSRVYEQSTKLFETLQSRYPYSRYAQIADLDIAYNQLRDNEQLLAVAAIERFMKGNPASPYLDYAYYLQGLAHFNDAQGFLSVIAAQDMSERDARSMRVSFESFQTLVKRFPDSRYVVDATRRMNYLIGAMAMHEVHIARYYYKRGAYLAAANRAKLALETYPQTVQIEHALALMVLAYDKLGMADLRDDARRVLDKNFPASRAVNEDSMIDRYWWAPG